MDNKIIVRQGETEPFLGLLEKGEPAFNSKDNLFYIGTGDGNFFCLNIPYEINYNDIKFNK
jgi:hypothetical protein